MSIVGYRTATTLSSVATIQSSIIALSMGSRICRGGRLRSSHLLLKHLWPARGGALAWLLRRAPNIFVIPGTTSIANLEENVAAGKRHSPMMCMPRFPRIRGR